MKQVTVMIGKDLDFQMPRARQIFFQEYRGIAKRGARFTLGFFQKCIKLSSIVNDAHAAAAATHRRFYNDGVADLPRNFLRFYRRLESKLGSRKNRNARRSC